MNTTPTPNFFVVLDLLIQAFHLDQEEPSLSGSGPFQHQLSGRRFDIKDVGMRELLGKFGGALLRSDVLPILRRTLRADTISPRAAAVRDYLGEGDSLPTAGGELGPALADRLAWLAQQHESFLSKARSQAAAANLEAAYGLQPLLRFAGHHLTIAISCLLWTEQISSADLDPEGPDMTWWREVPTSTPMGVALAAFAPGPSELLLRLAGADSGMDRNWDPKTLDNLRQGGPAHPTFQTLAAVVKEMAPPNPEAQRQWLARWRRWYGLRHLARLFAAVWGWEWLNGWLATILAEAHGIASAFRSSILDAGQRKVVASVGIWAGWRLRVARWAFGQLAVSTEADIHPVPRADFAAIARGQENLRLQHCFQVASGGPAMETELRSRGRTPEEARREALHLTWMGQSDHAEVKHLHPLAALEHAKERRDWPAMEVAARELVAQRPDISGNHRLFSDALAQQDKFEDALAVLRDAQRRFPGDQWLHMAEAVVMMTRGDLAKDHRDFEAARDKLLGMQLADADWNAQLHLADCHLALGDWEAAHHHARLVVQHHNQCGEAHAIASICAEKLGLRQPANKAAEHAQNRREQDLVALLRQRDARGELGSTSIRPIPRWHRIWEKRPVGWAG
jgi:tetratricopeptide (TPR) repeat protein